MGKKYRSVVGVATAVDTKTQLTTLGSEGTITPLSVPAGVRELEAIIVCAMANYAAAKAYVAMLRLEGAGLVGGNRSYIVGSGGTSVATGVEQAMTPKVIPVHLKVVPTNEIQVYGEMCGVDTGQVHFGVTLVYK